MLNPLVTQRKPRGRVAKAKSFMAPVLGWVSNNDIESNNPLSAAVLKNWVPTRNSIYSRNGKVTVSNLGSPVQSLISHASGVQRALIAAAGGALYNVPDTYDPGVGPVASTLIQDGFANSVWQYTSMANAADETATVMVNGIDGIYRYETVAGLEEVTPTGGSATGTYNNVIVFKGRLWFTEVGSSVAYYGDPLSNEPATLSPFPVGPFFSKGGAIAAMSGWSRDGGDGPDDYLVFISEKGEVVIFQGLDPGSDFNLVGTFHSAIPFGPRSLRKYGADVMFYSSVGPMTFSEIIGSPIGKKLEEIPIIQEFTDAIEKQFAAAGWEFVTYSKKAWVVYNVPIIPGVEYRQYCENLVNGSWFEITGWNALTLQIHNGQLFYGDSAGNICLADYGQNDDGNAIDCDFMQSWYDYEVPENKVFNLIQFTVNANTIPNVQLDIMTDYAMTPPESEPGFPAQAEVTPWDVSPWNSSKWSGALGFYVQTSGLAGVGYVGAVRYRSLIKDNRHELRGYRVVYQQGGIL